MRSDMVAALQRLNLGTYRVSTDLPWEHNGQPLYFANPRRLYVTAAETTQTQITDSFNTLGSAHRGWVTETVTMIVVFINDAKSPPANYQDVVQQIQNLRTADFTAGYTSRLCQVSEDFDSDLMRTQLEFSFNRLIS